MEGSSGGITDLMAGWDMITILRALLLALAGYWVGRRLSILAVKQTQGRLEGHARALLGRAVYYLTVGLFFASALKELGFSLGVLMGAAGIMTVAIGFAAQTSASNFISGLFLLGERPFGVGDVVQVGDFLGEVIAIDPLAVKLRTFDNRQVRIPNETLIKTEVVTLTRFPIRRIDLKVGVAYKEDIRRVHEVLKQVAATTPNVLAEPEPFFMVDGYGDSSVNLLFAVWTTTPTFGAVRLELFIRVKEAFDKEGIEIPFPHLSLYTGEATGPMPIRLDPPRNEENG